MTHYHFSCQLWVILALPRIDTWQGRFDSLHTSYLLTSLLVQNKNPIPIFLFVNMHATFSMSHRRHLQLVVDDDVMVMIAVAMTYIDTFNHNLHIVSVFFIYLCHAKS